MLEKIAYGLTRKPKLVVTIALLALIPSVLGYIATRVNYDILSYLPQDLPSSQGEKLLEEPFRMAAISMLIVENMPSGYTNDLLNAIKKVDGVSNAIWLSNLVGVQIPVDMIPAEFRDVFFSGESTMMIIQYENAGASDETMDAIQEIRSICNEKCFIAGFSVVVKDTRDIMNSELPIFVGLAVLLAMAAMALTLESWALPFLFIASIGLAVLYNLGTNIFVREISYMTLAIAPVLQLGVTVDYSIFLYHRYVAERPNYDDQRDAMAQAIVAAFRSLSGSSLTTVAGFLALCFMRMTLGLNIGLVMAKGVVLGIVTVVFVLPSLLLLSDHLIEKYRHRTLIPRFDRVNGFIIRHRVLFVVIALLMVVPAVYSDSHAAIYYKIDEALPRDLPSIVANEKLKDEFDMATSHFIVLREDLSSYEMQDIEDRLKALDGITSVISYHSMLGTGIPDFFVPEAVRNMLKQGGCQLMMVNSSYEPATDGVAAQLDEMTAILEPYDPEVMITGEGAMYRDLIKTMDVDFQTTNYISIAAIFLIVLVVFQSLSVPVALVATIEFAIMVNEGLNYYTGAEAAFIAPTLISCIQLGATVDYAILMTSRFQEELQGGMDRREAIHIAANTSDHSIITSALVMFCATLGVSFVSSIDLIGDICLMLARGAIISALVSIFLMPALLCVMEPAFNVTSLHWKPKAKKETPEEEAEASPEEASGPEAAEETEEAKNAQDEKDAEETEETSGKRRICLRLRH